MNAVSKPITFSWIPKGGGKGGQFSNASSHDADSDMLAQVSQYIVDGGKWKGRPADVPFGLLPVNYYANSLEIFNSYTTVNQVYDSFLMVSLRRMAVPYGNRRGYFTASGVFNILDSVNDGAHLKSGSGPAVFQVVKNRCYACDGQIEGVSGHPGPRIYYDKLGTGLGLVGVNWGLPTPLPNLQISPDPASYQIGTCQPQTGSAVVIGMSFDPRVHLAEGMPFYIESSAASGQYYEFVIKSCDSAVQLTLTTPWIGAGYVGAKCQGNYGSMTWGAAQPNVVVGTATTNGSVNVTAIAGFDAQVFCKVGYRLLIETADKTQVWNTYIITGIVSATAVQVQGNTIESYAGARIRVDLPVTSSGISSDSSYRYAMSYYDSARGHIGNPGPVFTVNWGPPFNKRINIKVQNIVDAPLSSGIDGTEFLNPWTYDKIILWRSGANGATLQSRVLLNPVGGGGNQAFTDNLSDDTQLGQVGPIGAGISGQITAHSPPPADLNFATFFEGRFFGASTRNPGILYWTALGGQEIDHYGIPEECWPPLNTLPIPESDGAITGIRTVGSSLIVETQKNLYQVSYNTTNTTSLFRLSRLSAKGLGTTHWATATLPGEDAQSGDILVHFGNDKRLYLLYGAGGDIPISYPIQDVLNTWLDPSVVRVGIRHDQSATYILLFPNQGTEFVPSSALPFLYDLDRKIWLGSNIQQTAYVEGMFQNVTVGFIGGIIGDRTIYKMAAAPTVMQGTAGKMTIKTQWLTPPGMPRMDEKELQAVILWASGLDVNTFYVVGAATDEGMGLSSVFRRLDTTTDPFLKIYTDTPNCHVYVPSTAEPLTGRTFQITAEYTPLVSGTLSYPPELAEIMGVWSHTTDESAAGGVL